MIQLESYKATIVSQKEEIEEKTVTISRLSDDLHSARKAQGRDKGT